MSAVAPSEDNLSSAHLDPIDANSGPSGDTAVAWLNRAVAAHRSGDSDRALDLLDRAARQAPDWEEPPLRAARKIFTPTARHCERPRHTGKR